MSHAKKQPSPPLSEAEQTTLLKLPLHSTAEIRTYARPAEGMERVAGAVLARLSRHAALAESLHIDAARLNAQVNEATALADLERRAEALRRRAFENRLANESDVYRALLKLNRVVQHSDDPELAIEFKDLADWVLATHPGHDTPPHPPAAPTAGTK
jgi:hypothetical protein